MVGNPDAQLTSLPGQWESPPGPETDWRQLYWTEVRLRQAEAERAQAAIAQLKAQIQQLQPPPGGAHALPVVPHAPSPEQLTQLQQEVAGHETIAELKARLLEVLRDRHRLLAQVQELRQALTAEQEAHAQTHQSLTTSLSDVMEALVQARERTPD